MLLQQTCFPSSNRFSCQYFKPRVLQVPTLQTLDLQPYRCHFSTLITRVSWRATSSTFTFTTRSHTSKTSLAKWPAGRESWDILCVLNEDGYEPFNIKCAGDTTIQAFKKAIHRTCINKLSHIQPHELKLNLIPLQRIIDDNIIGTVSILELR